MTAENRPENPIPSYEIQVNRGALDWYLKIADNLKEFRGSNISLTELPTSEHEKTERVNLNLQGNPVDIDRFRILTNVLHNSFGRKEENRVTEALLIESVRLMQIKES